MNLTLLLTLLGLIFIGLAAFKVPEPRFVSWFPLGVFLIGCVLLVN